MKYLIDARLERGRPQLRIVDARTGAVRLQWTDSGALAPRGERSEGLETAGEGCTCGARASLRRLFKALTVLACAERISLVEHARSPAFGEECLDCTVCVDRSEPPVHWPARDNVVPLRDAQRDARRAGGTTQEKASGTDQTLNTTHIGE